MACFVIDIMQKKHWNVIREYVQQRAAGKAHLFPERQSAFFSVLFLFPLVPIQLCLKEDEEKKNIRGAKEASLLGKRFLLKHEDLSQILIIHIKTEHSHSVPL